MTRMLELAVAHTDATTALHLSDLMFDLLSPRGIIVTAVEDKADRWRVEALLPPGERWADVCDELAQAYQPPLPAFSVDAISEDAWQSAPQPELEPIKAGRFIVHDTAHKPAALSGIAVEIDAGLAFGTGHHATTAGCLTALDDILKSRKISNPLDLGCGTAVLAIAVAKALRLEVMASDIDPVAVRVAAENAAKNGVASLVHTLTAVGFDHQQIAARAPYDLILANILANPLMELARAMRQHMTAGGTAILSGILAHQAQRVAARYRAVGFVMERSRTIAEWSVLVLRAE